MIYLLTWNSNSDTDSSMRQCWRAFPVAQIGQSAAIEKNTDLASEKKENDKGFNIAECAFFNVALHVRLCSWRHKNI